MGKHLGQPIRPGRLIVGGPGFPAIEEVIVLHPSQAFQHLLHLYRFTVVV